MVSESTSAAGTNSCAGPWKQNSDNSCLIPHVHNLSPTKRNQKNTVDYSTLVLQTKDELIDSLLYSPNKNGMLQISANSHTPIKLQWFTKTARGDKIIINDIANITTPKSI